MCCEELAFVEVLRGWCNIDFLWFYCLFLWFGDCFLWVCVVSCGRVVLGLWWLGLTDVGLVMVVWVCISRFGFVLGFLWDWSGLGLCLAVLWDCI